MPTFWLFAEQLVGNGNCEEEATDLEVSASYSSPGGESYCGEEWSYSLDLMDGNALDGELGKRLNQMIPIPVSVSLSSRSMPPFSLISLGHLKNEFNMVLHVNLKAFSTWAVALCYYAFYSMLELLLL